MSAASSGTDGTMPATSKRNPLERAFVWGLIAVLGILTIVECWYRYSYQRAYDSVGDRLTVAPERGPGALDAADVKTLFGGREPSRTEAFSTPDRQVINGAAYVEVYSWFTLNPIRPREIYVYYDHTEPAGKAHAEVISIQSVEEEIVSYPTESLSPARQRKMQSFMNEVNEGIALKTFAGMPGLSSGKTAPGETPQVEDSDAKDNRAADQTPGDQQLIDEADER